MAYLIVFVIIASLALIPSVQEIIRKWLLMLDYTAREERAESEWEEIERDINILFEKPIF